MKPSLLSALVPVSVFVAAMIHGARADEINVDPPTFVSTKVIAVPVERAGVNPDGHMRQPKSDGGVTPQADFRPPSSHQS